MQGIHLGLVGSGITPLAYMAVRRRGIRFSQQMTAPIFPTEVSNTGSVEPSPNPQIRRSEAVGISLRCFPRYSPPASKNNTVQYKVPPALSITPITTDILYLPARDAILSTSGPANAYQSNQTIVLIILHMWFLCRNSNQASPKSSDLGHQLLKHGIFDSLHAPLQNGCQSRPRTCSLEDTHPQKLPETRLIASLD